MPQQKCPACLTLIVPSDDGKCPSCGADWVETEASSLASTQSHMSGPCPSDQQLRDYLQDNLAADEKAQIEDHVDACPLCNERLRLLCDELEAEDEAAADPIPERIGNYLVGDLLGQGAFGDVYRAENPELGRTVAIKILKRTVTSSGFRRRLTSEEYQERIAQFREEARTLVALEHPHIVPVYEFEELPDGRRCILSKFIDGGSLAERIASDRPSAKGAAEIIATVAQALHHAHSQRLVHRDIKPANILLDQAGKPYVADFGLALSEDDYGSRDALQGGTPAYMSPEQARLEGHLVDNRSDIFSLGVVPYELPGGAVSFAGQRRVGSRRGNRRRAQHSIDAKQYGSRRRWYAHSMNDRP